jgi:hypothetical protein
MEKGQKSRKGTLVEYDNTYNRLRPKCIKAILLADTDQQNWYNSIQFSSIHESLLLPDFDSSALIFHLL